MKKNLIFVALFAFIFSFSATSQCGQVSLIGEFTDWTDDYYLDRDPENPELFSTILILTEGDDMSNPPDGIIEMKFRENGDWAVNWGSPDFPSGTAVLNGDSIPVPVGSYLVTFNCITLEYYFLETCGLIGLVGEFNSWTDDLWMTRNTENPDIWTTIIALTEEDDTNNDGIVEMKFRENADWEVNWGSPDFPSGIGVQDGPNIPVPLDDFGVTTDYLVTFNCATGEYNFQLTCGEVSLIGEFTGWADDLFIQRDENNPDLWSVVLTLTEDDDMSNPPDGIIEVKFRENSDWEINWGSSNFPSGIAMLNGPNIPVPLDNTGLTTDYLVTFNYTTLAYNFEATSGDISIIGAFNGWIDDVPMNRSASDPNFWTLTRSWYENSEVKFRENEDWTINWGNTNWPSGIGLQNGPNIPLIQGIYDVTFNSSTGEYNFVDNPDVCGEIGMVGDFNDWGDDGTGIPTDVYLLRDPVYPSNFSKEYFFPNNTGLLFRVDADASFQNVWGGTFPGGAGIFGDPTQIIEVPGGKYYITFNCKSGDFYFEKLSYDVIAPKVFTMNIDGILDESEWNINQPVSQVVDGTVGSDLNEAFFGVTYNEDYLYVGVEVTDAIINSGDLVEIFVDGDKSGGDYDDFDVHFTVTSNGEVNVVTGPTGGITPEAFVSTTDTSYIVEAGIPWADLSVSPVEDEQMGFDILVGDDDTGTGIEYTLAWNGGLQNYESTSSFGELFFGPLSCGCISLYNESIGDVVLRNPSEMPTTYVATYELFEDQDVLFRKDMQDMVSWGANSFPNGFAVIGGPAIPAITGRYRITFDCSSGEYSFTDEPVGEGVAYAVYTETPATIDGDLSEYDLIYGSELVVVGTGPNNNEVTWGALWDSSSFYIGAHVDDAVVEGSGSPWDNDAIEFYIDGNHDEDGAYDSDFDTQLILDFVNQSTLWIKADGVPITDYESNWTATADGYNVELRIGWSNIDFYASKGTTIGWSLSNNDSDYGMGRDYQTTWYGTENNWNNTADFGDLQMTDELATGLSKIVNYKTNIVLIPNPTSGNVCLKTMGDDFAGEITIYITDLAGRPITVQKETITGPGNHFQLYTSQLNSGIYLVSVVGKNGEKAVKKLIIK
jgi:hypothetical protein